AQRTGGGGGHGSAHCNDCDQPDTRATDVRQEATQRAATNAVVHSGPAAASNCDAVSDAVCRVDELPEDQVLRARGLRRAGQLHTYVVGARILGGNLQLVDVHGRVARTIARPWGTCRAGAERIETRRCAAARAHAASLDTLDGRGRNRLAMAVQPVVWTDQLRDASCRLVSRPYVGVYANR